MRGVLKIAARKAHHPADEFEAKATQQAFGQHTFHGVQAHLKNAIDKDRCQIGETQAQQQLHLRDLITPDINHTALSANRIVDDPFRQFQRGVKKWEGEKREGQQKQLLPAGMFPNKGKQALFHVPVFRLRGRA